MIYKQDTGLRILCDVNKFEYRCYLHMCFIGDQVLLSPVKSIIYKHIESV